MKNTYAQKILHAKRNRSPRYKLWIRSFLMALTSLILFTGISKGQNSPVTGEKLVNNVTAGDQEGYFWSLRTMAVQPLGGYVICWIDNAGLDGQAAGIYVRRFDANGIPQGNQILVNTTTSGSQYAPSLSVAPNGNFVVAWFGPGSGTDVWGQLFSRDGVKIGTEFILSTTVGGNQRFPEVVFLSDGTFIAGFQDGAQSVLQRFDATARQIGQETRITSGGAVQLDGLAAMPDDRVLMFWTDAGEVYGQLFTTDVVPIGTRTQLNTTIADVQQYPYGRADAYGNITMVWESVGQDGSGVGVYARRFDANMNPLTPEFAVTTSTTNDQYGPIVIMDGSGRHVISWTDNNNRDGGGTAGGESGTSVWMQEYNSAGVAVGTETMVNVTTSGRQLYPVGEINSAGKFVIAWEGNGAQPGEVDDDGIFARAYQFSQTGTSSISVTPSVGVASDIVTLTLTLTNPTTINNVVANPPSVAGTNGVFAELVSGPSPASVSVGPGGVNITWTYRLTTEDNPGILLFGANAQNSADGAIFPFAVSNTVAVTPAIYLSDLTAPNLIGDANKPATEGPNVFTIGAKVTNAGLEELTDVVVYLGDGVTPGTFPTTTMTLAQTNNTYQGTFSLSALSGTSDCIRPILKLGPAKIVINGGIDFNGDNVVDGSDDGVLSNGKTVIDGRVDVNNSAAVDGSDDLPRPPGKFFGYREPPIIDGNIDINSDGIINASDAGTYGGETRNLYWQVSYATVDANGIGVYGNCGDFNDDLRYRWKIWTTGIEGGITRQDHIDEYAKVRCESNANTNKIYPSGSWVSTSPPRIITGLVDISGNGTIGTNDDGPFFGKNVIDGYVDMNGDNVISAADDGTLNGYPVIDGRIDLNSNGNIGAADDGILVQPGQTFSITFNNATFGNVGAGFDENRDGIPDYDMWYQPIGEVNFPTNSFRLIDIKATVRGTGGTSLPPTLYDNEPYLSQLVGPTGGSFDATYTYTFVVIGTQSGAITPYQEAASGADNEKYNGDYGVNFDFRNGLPALTLTKTRDIAVMKVCDEVTWTMNYQNISTSAVGDPGSGNGVVIEDVIPASLSYVAGSASSMDLTTTIFYSTNNGASWVTTEPVPASNVNRIRWYVEEVILGGQGGTVSFKTTMKTCQPNASIITNTAAIKIGTTADIATATASVTVSNVGPVVTTPAVPRSFVGCSTDVISGPAFSNKVAASTEAEFENATNQGAASDDCGITEVSYIDVASGTNPIVVTRTWSFKDICGNTITSPQIITITEPICVLYQTTKNGVWSDVSVWETKTACAASWAPAASIPPSGANVMINHVISQDVNYTVAECPLILADNGVSKLSIEPDITLNFGGGTDGNAYFNGRPVVVRSTENGTGAIGTMLVNSKTIGDNNVTVERYIPGSKRRWNVLTFGVTNNTATIRDAWAGGSRARVANSQNSVDGVPLGTPPPPYDPKPDNVPYDAGTGGLPADYVPGDGTIITGHRHSVASTANGQGYDWWPELIIPKDAIWWQRTGTFPNYTYKSVKAGSLQTTPSSIRPFIPGNPSDFGPSRGTDWVSTSAINTGFGGSGLINMNLTDAFNAHQAFMIFTRGDRKVLENWYNPTTLRPTGQLMTLTKTVPVYPKGIQNLTVVGNPYPAPVDFDKVYDLLTNQGVIEPFFYIWDSNLPGTSGHGAWRAVFRVSDGVWHSTINEADPDRNDPDITTNNPQLVSSSQGILVEGTVGGGNLTFNEDMKADITQVQILPFEEEEDLLKPGLLFTNLNTRSATSGNLSIVDGVAIMLGKGYNQALTDKTDIRKVNSITGELGLSLKRDNQILMVESYPNPTQDAIFPLETRNLEQRSYALTFSVDNLYRDGREVYLNDKFLNTLTPISTVQKTVYNFEGTTDAGSVSPSRFEIVMKTGSVLPVTFTYVNAAEQRGDVNVTWGVVTEKNMNRYEVEYSRNGIDFGKSIKVDAKNVSPADYNWLHVQPGTGNHFYRVRAVDNDGKNLLTRVVKVSIGGDKPDFKVFPTVVSYAADVTLQMISLEKGNYNLQVVDMSGRVIQSQTIQHNGGSASLLMKLPASLSAGKYSIRLNNQEVNFVESILKDR